MYPLKDAPTSRTKRGWRTRESASRQLDRPRSPLGLEFLHEPILLQYPLCKIALCYPNGGDLSILMVDDTAAIPVKEQTNRLRVGNDARLARVDRKLSLMGAESVGEAESRLADSGRIRNVCRYHTKGVRLGLQFLHDRLQGRKQTASDAAITIPDDKEAQDRGQENKRRGGTDRPPASRSGLTARKMRSGRQAPSGRADKPLVWRFNARHRDTAP